MFMNDYVCILSLIRIPFVRKLKKNAGIDDNIPFFLVTEEFDLPFTPSFMVVTNVHQIGLNG